MCQNERAESAGIIKFASQISTAPQTKISIGEMSKNELQHVLLDNSVPSSVGQQIECEIATFAVLTTT